MDESRARGEMPFLDHLEELRWRILWSLAAVLAGTVIGFVVVQHFDVLALLKRPIAPFLPAGKLFITRPTDAFIITLKLAALVGIVLAAPIVIWQVWAFFAPALYPKEKRFVVPAFIAGFVLFVAGVRWVHLAALGAGTLVAILAVLWLLPASGVHVLKPYQEQRLTGFTHPASDPAGATYNVAQSINAVGAGGVRGRGDPERARAMGPVPLRNRARARLGAAACGSARPGADGRRDWT